MHVAHSENFLIPGYVNPPFVSLAFRLLRDGEVTPGKKIVRVYRDWGTANYLSLAFETIDGEATRPCRVRLSELLGQGEWLVAGQDDAPPRRTRAVYMTLNESGTYTFNITSPVDKPEGFGYLAGEFPDGITTRLDTPISATIKVLHTTADGRMGKVAEVVSNPDGTWIVDNLDPTKQFDVICSLEGFNDLVLSKVSPTPY